MRFVLLLLWAERYECHKETKENAFSHILLSQPCKPTQANSVAAAELRKNVATLQIPEVYALWAGLGRQKAVRWCKHRGAEHQAESCYTSRSYVLRCKQNLS